MAAKPKSTTPEPTPAPSAVRANKISDGLDLMEWVQVNSRLLGGAAAVIAVAAAGYWFYIRSQQIKTINADRSLMQAEQSLQSGNAALASERPAACRESLQGHRRRDGGGYATGSGRL